jgi:hypothetical protein
MSNRKPIAAITQINHCTGVSFGAGSSGDSDGATLLMKAPLILSCGMSTDDNSSTSPMGRRWTCRSVAARDLHATRAASGA